MKWNEIIISVRNIIDFMMQSNMANKDEWIERIDEIGLLSVISLKFNAMLLSILIFFVLFWMHFRCAIFFKFNFGTEEPTHKWLKIMY